MRILAIGDVTGKAGIEHLKKNLWKFRESEKIDFCVVNGENASFISGISRELAEELLAAGADVISGGNHTLYNKAAYSYLDEEERILRPINFGAEAPGHGYTVADCLGYRMLVISAMGNVNIEPCLDSPFGFLDRTLAREEGKYDFAILDIHAEATGEKNAIAYAYDGKINVIFGTHTHVPTADERVLPRGTGYITDLGMCGEGGGVLGMDAETVIFRMRTKLPQKFIPSSGEVIANGAIFELDTKSGRTLSVRRVNF